MKSPKRFRLFLCLLMVTVAAACSPIKKLEVWKEETYSTHPQKMLLIAIAKRDRTRRQAENVLANQLVKRGLEAIPSYKVLPQEEKLDRQAVEAKVRELGFDSVLVARSISQKEITNHQYGGVILGGTAVYSNGGWYGYGYGYSYNREYDSDYFIISTKLYDVDSEMPAWSYLAQIKVDGSRERAINQLIPTIVEQLEASEIIQ
ncbi:MAG: hypothetical protein JRE01_02300 [Deltaproteobacteria bacterium]|nr:hypothetical protein [Deltaproteobacteria bacterium]MDH4006922.1 hypothetical protein [Desulfuromonadales bacterium]